VRSAYSATATFLYKQLPAFEVIPYSYMRYRNFIIIIIIIRRRRDVTCLVRRFLRAAGWKVCQYVPS